MKFFRITFIQTIHDNNYMLLPETDLDTVNRKPLSEFAIHLLLLLLLFSILLP